MFGRSLVFAGMGLCLLAGTASAGTIVNLKNQAPEGVDIAFQLTDGRVLGQSFTETHWYILTPDNKGSYVNGTWSRAADLPSDYGPYAFSSAVLADGRVVVQGGEYTFGNFELTNRGEIYDPTKNTWTKLNPPPKWHYIGDSGAGVLADGRYFVLDKLNTRMAALDPSTMTWTALSTKGKNDFNSEEGPVLLPDGSLLVVDVKDAPHTERYFPANGIWQDAGQTPSSLKSPPCCDCVTYGKKQKCYHPPGETGPAILRPDGTVFATGACNGGEPCSGSDRGHTAVYHPDLNSWTAGPDFPSGDDAGDSFASLLPNGNVLVAGNSGTAYEFDGKKLNAQSACICGESLMILPSGEVLLGGDAVYQASGTYKAAWQPTISSAPSSVKRGSTYQISGTQFNGLSQANGFGDELMTYTNYPLVRITNNASGHVFYARTHDHSTMGVATGNATVSTNFDVPSGIETGASSLVVVANGIPSDPVSITVN
ncbi:MAG: hypothetical protein JOY77_07610 [Alphaproteobacteria bacterium]|nr:hypothetical protein [Alphaproteobacteria bacterium]MBV9062782.1 hypothetical protein [Alphaproteobacteria bacterium]